MSVAGRRLLEIVSPEDIFEEFVRNAKTLSDDEPTVRTALDPSAETRPAPRKRRSSGTVRVERASREDTQTTTQRTPLERSENGHAPAGVLDRTMRDIESALREGDTRRARARAERLLASYPGDLLFLRRLAQLYTSYGARETAIETWFLLAAQYFERDNEREMRGAIREVLTLDKSNRKAYRLLSLLEQR